MSLSIFDVNDRVAVVTGGGSGIGRRLAHALAEAGAAVTVADVDGARAENTTSEIIASNGQAMAVTADVRSLSGAIKIVQAATEGFGAPDILINNAGVNVLKPALELSVAEWDRLIDTNLKGVFFCSQAAARSMKSRGGGKIINLASQLGLVGFPDRVPYCASKGGVIQLTRALAVEWAPYNINVNAIAPTFTMTPATASMLADPRFRKVVEDSIPFGRIGVPDDLVGAVIFLSSRASDFVTGHVLVVDGGRSAK